MTFDYAALAATATRLLSAFGREVAIRRASGAVFDSVVGEWVGGSTWETTTNAVFVGLDSRYAAGFSIEVGDRMAILDASMEPLPSDCLTIDGAAYGIVAVQPINPAGVPLAYRVQVRS